MLSVSPCVARRPCITPTSIGRFSELVNKIGTSGAYATRKRKTKAIKTLKKVFKEHRRFAKSAKLRAVAMTLTYRESKDFNAKCISTFLKRLRETLKRKGHALPYAWVLERAKQLLHYHLIIWLPRGVKLDPAKLAKWWGWGSTWIEGCRKVTAWEKYLTKIDNTKRPKGARIYGYGGLDNDGETAVARTKLPRWLLPLVPVAHRARRMTGGGWIDMQTGEIFQSPYIWTPRGPVRRPTLH